MLPVHVAFSVCVLTLFVARSEACSCPQLSDIQKTCGATFVAEVTVDCEVITSFGQHYYNISFAQNKLYKGSADVNKVIRKLDTDDLCAGDELAVGEQFLITGIALGDTQVYLDQCQLKLLSSELKTKQYTDLRTHLKNLDKNC